MADTPHFSAEERETLHRIIRARRDMRHFLKGASVADEVLQRILEAAHAAPSVGLMQPWRFIRICDGERREQIAKLVNAEKARTADALGERKADFLRLKVEGIRDCAELIAVVQAPDDGTLFGRRTLPEEMALCSTACAIQNMWLAARAENLGMGWVSLFDPAALARQLNCPTGAHPIALLCIGPVAEFYPEPMLVQEGWREEREIGSVVFEDCWPDSGK